MKIQLQGAAAVYRRVGGVRVLVAVLTALALLTGCPSVPRSGPLVTPTFSALDIPLPAGGGWTNYSTTSPPAEVLPTRGRSVRVWFYAPVGSSFSVSLKALDTTLTPLTQNFGTPAPPEAGYFQMVSVNEALNPPLYTMLVRAPLALMDPANFDILIVNASLRTDVSDSAPLVVPLRQRKVFTVTVQVKGNGHVTSNPPGIQCGTTASGTALSPCSYEFGRGQVSLLPGANDLNTTKFSGWTGNCASGVQVCQNTLDGMAPIAATATFEPRASTTTASVCPVAPLLPGLRWIDLPQCGGNLVDKTNIELTPRCDASGYFCCKDGAGSGRCAPKIEFPADCMHRSPTGTLRQPGGCYEVDSNP